MFYVGSCLIICIVQNHDLLCGMCFNVLLWETNVLGFGKGCCNY
jgi:hypothetical protein